MIKLRALCFLVLPMLYADPVLQTAGNFVVLGGTAHPGVTNSGPTTLTGDLGVYSDNSITGLSSITVNGATAVGNPAVHIADAVAQQAQSDLTTAILGLSGEGPGTSLSASAYTAGIVTLLPGVFSTGSTFDLTGTLTLDFKNLSNASFIFLIGSSLMAEHGSTVALQNVGSNDSVFWVMPAGSAAIGTGATFAGNILANTSITFGDSATLNCGRALASTGDVTMLTNTLSIGCENALVTTSGGTEAGNVLLEGSNGLSGGITITPRLRPVALQVTSLLLHPAPSFPNPARSCCWAPACSA
jgi:ice-binding like protein